LAYTTVSPGQCDLACASVANCPAAPVVAVAGRLVVGDALGCGPLYDEGGIGDLPPVPEGDWLTGAWAADNPGMTSKTTNAMEVMALRYLGLIASSDDCWLVVKTWRPAASACQ